MTIHDLKEYEVLDAREIADINSYGYILRHRKSGARISILSNDDNNKVFYIGFRTTPTDETGVPHIIEHTTLCGSEKFPVKDPFVELVKGSLNTFLNAMTYPDKTIYPIASCNDQDFKNLMDVYLDAVFHPNITKYKEIFMQEGWHYELESEDDPITINGVVYNEMKGAYSSPDEVLHHEIMRSLFPDNTYSQSSGGNPVHIPELTYEQYIEFYHKYYHAANSYIYLYGDMDVVERLIWLDKEYLSQFEYEEIDSDIPMQHAFDKIKDVVGSFSISSDDSDENRTYLSYNRVIETSLEPMLYQAFDILDYALVSSPGAPVKKALIDAGIGEEVYGSYYEGMKQPVFCIIAKNANENQHDKFVEIVEDSLRQQVKNGINKEALLAGINSSEFRFREADFGQFPKGLLYGLQCLDSWLFDDMKPYIHLECLDTFAKLKEQINTGYFETLVEKYLLDNTHGSTVMVVPQKGKNEEEEKQLVQQLEDYKNSLTREQINALIQETKHLKEYQETPSSDEELRKLPMLKREDMKKEAMPFSNIELQLDGIKVVRHDVETNGIHYINMMFDSCDIKAQDIGYLGLLASVLGYVDTAGYSYTDLSNSIYIYTGGISTGASVHPDLRAKNEVVVNYTVKLKVLQENLEEGMKLIKEIINTSKFDDVKRLSEIVAQIKSRLQVNLSSSRHTVSVMRSLAGWSKYAFYQEKLRGIDYYRFICEIEGQLKEKPDIVIDKLREVCKTIFVKNRLVISYTATEAMYEKSKEILAKYLSDIQQNSEISTECEMTLSCQNEGFMDSSQIMYVAKTGDFSADGAKYVGTFKILKQILEYDYLWTNVRIIGGAYGCFASFLRSGECYLASYRDPNLEKTLEIYDRLPEFLRSFDKDERDMTKLIIGTFSNLDTPLNPEANGNRSMAAYLEGLEYEDVQRERDEVLNATPEDIRKLADVLECMLKQNHICVLGNEKVIKESEGIFDRVEKLI